jgi:hypothetical protein
MIQIVDDQTEHEPLTYLSRPLAEARFQAAIVRALLEELKHPDAPAAMKKQVAEELEILSHRIMEVGEAIRESSPRVSDAYPTWTHDAFDDERESA